MKKLLLVGLMIAFAGISLAETPKLVNPPRPTKKYKTLIVIKHKECIDPECFASDAKTHLHYVYTNNGWRVKYSEYGLLWLHLPKDPKDRESYDLNSLGKFGPFREENILLEDRENSVNYPLVLDAFFEAKAPGPAPSQNVTKKETPTPQKAKVVFR